MRSSKPFIPSRVRAALGLAAGVAGPLHPVVAAGHRAAGTGRDPDASLARLLEGNKRFVSGQLVHPGRKPEDFAALAEGQAPLGDHRRLCRFAGGARADLRSRSRRPVRAARCGQHRQRRRPGHEGEHRVCGRRNWASG